MRVMLPYLARNPKTTLKFLSLYVREHDFWSSDAVFTIREYTNTVRMARSRNRAPEIVFTQQRV